MTRTLILTRHAKSSWAVPGLADHDRPLNKRGQRSAKAIGAWLEEHGAVPDEVLCSSAQRTQETWALMALQMEAEPQLNLLEALYHAASSQMLALLRRATGRTVLMLGHNPGIAEFAEAMVERPPDHPDFSRYPTCATTVLRFDVEDWKEVAPGSGHAEAFVVPRELTD
ncbi:MAG: histidine phosphatase family protein [Pseudomonadota bacterium]